MSFVEAKAHSERGRSKVVRLDMNGKRMDFPRRVVHVRRSGASPEVALHQKHINTTPVNEIYVRVRPGNLRSILTDADYHQGIKDDVRNAIEAAGGDGINMLRLGMENLPVDKTEKESGQYRPFSRPTPRICEKMFDLCDIEGVDIIGIPTPSTYAHDWATGMLNVFQSRQPDYLGEHMLLGTINVKLPEADARRLARRYLDSGLEGFCMDFESLRVRETWMRGIIDEVNRHAGGKDTKDVPISDTRWGNVYVHGSNVPYFPFHGTHRRAVNPSYDFLVSIYGLDSFGNLRMVPGGSDNRKITKKEAERKIVGKRYRVTDTYGEYNHASLQAYGENHAVRCPCPSCKRKNPLELYADVPPTPEGLKGLHETITDHRLYVTHTEVNGYAALIRKHGLTDHLGSKRQAANEVKGILSSVSRSP